MTYPIESGYYILSGHRLRRDCFAVGPGDRYVTVPRPRVPTDRLADDGWAQLEDSERTFFESPMVTVRSRFVLYEDRRLRERVRETTGVDQLWRSFFASRLVFRGPLTAGLGTIIDRLVRPQATTRFVDDLRDRGFRDIDRRGSRRLRIDSDREGTAIEYTLAYPIDRADMTAQVDPDTSTASSVRGTAWLVIWAVDRDVLLSGGTYPREAIATDDDMEQPVDPTTYRTELFELIRSVTG